VTLKKIIATGALAAGLTVAGLSTPAPAAAVPPGEIYDYYVDRSECQSVGNNFVRQGLAWRATCSLEGGNGLWALYVVFWV
jgi:hypothetical protein